MTETSLRVLFCFGINQNFFDLPTDGVTNADVWQATVALINGIKEMDGVEYIADIDDDSHVVGPAGGWPWTFYVLADLDSQATVKAVCNLLRTIPVGESGHKLWKDLKVEARIGRSLIPRSY